MAKHDSKIDIHRLREIGWSKWDPIGLCGAFGSWKGQGFEDEYDRYLIHAAGLLIGGAEPSTVVDYLYNIETKDMGSGLPSNEKVRRAQILAVVDAISNDPFVSRMSGPS